MQRTRTTMLGVGLAGILALAGAPLSALAQNALGDGRALDRNMQRGSGGVNTKVRDLDAQIRLNNAIITGNAAYGRSFRGNAGYLATDEFRAGLGSNDLFRERREMAGSAILGGAATGGSGIFQSVDPATPGAVRFTQRGIRGTDALRYQMALTTGSASPDDADASPLTLRRSGAGASGNTVGNTMRSTAEFRAQRSTQPTVLGTDIGPDGKPMALLASPLIGVKARGIETNYDPTATDQPSKWRPTGVESQSHLARERFSALEQMEKPKSSDAVSTKVESESGAVGGVLERFQAEAQARSAASGRIDTSVRTNDLTPVRPQSPTTPTPGGPSDGTPGARPTDRPGDGSTSPTAPGDKPDAGNDAPPNPGEPAWRSTLEDMRRTLRGEKTRRETKPDATAPDGAAPKEPKTTQTPLTPEERRINIDARVKAALDAQGVADQDAFSVEQIEAAKKARVKVESMIAGQPASVYYVDRMLDGEHAIKTEKYFDAEDAFSRALAASPGDALARAGRVHAQIGAGLYMSAAANLRDLYTSRPEMIGVKYGTDVMPAAERLKVIREQLEKVSAKTDSALSGDAGLLLAYLAYQAGDLPGVDTGLKAFSLKIASDGTADLALLELAARVWKSPVPADLPVLEKGTIPSRGPAAPPPP